jgi:hypothetical protein
MRTAHSLLRLVSILLDLAQDALQFLLLGTRSSAALKAENISSVNSWPSTWSARLSRDGRPALLGYLWFYSRGFLHGRMP